MPGYFRFSALCCAVAALLASGPVRGAEVPLTESGGTFDRDVVNLKAGDSLLVANNDKGNHNLTLTDEDAGDAQDLGVQHPGHTLRLKFENAGTYKLRCTLTPDMRARVIVH